MFLDIAMFVVLQQTWQCPEHTCHYYLVIMAHYQKKDIASKLLIVPTKIVMLFFDADTAK